MIVFLAAVILMLIGLYGVAVKRSLVKIAISLMLIQYSVDLLLIALAREAGGREWFSQLAALIGLATTIILIALIRRNFDRNQTLDVAKLNKLKG
jgi:multisubunit Na+/H+ antiporter MnhC subunit